MQQCLIATRVSHAGALDSEMPASATSRRIECSATLSEKVLRRERPLRIVSVRFPAQSLLREPRGRDLEQDVHLTLNRETTLEVTAVWAQPLPARLRKWR